MTLQRLIFREIALPFVVALLLLGQLLVVMQLLQLNEVLFGGGFDPAGILRTASYLAPHFAIAAIPLSFLLAILLGLGRLSEDNELLAFAALGRSPNSLYAVPVILALLLGAVVGVLGFSGEAWGMRGLRQQLNELIKKNVAAEIRPGTFFEDIPRFTVFVAEEREAEGGEPSWDRVLLWDARDERAPLLLLSRAGRVESEGADALLTVELEAGELHRTDATGAYTRAQFEGGTVALGVGDFLRRRNKFNRPANELTVAEMPQAAAEARQAGDETSARRIETVFHARHAAIFTCLIFGLIGVPLAARGRSGRGRSFVATLLAYAGYYVLLTIAAGLGESGRAPPMVAAWMPNTVGLVLAFALFLRLQRRQLAHGAAR